MDLGEIMIYFIRHGETDYNLKGIVQGQLDIPLNQKGIESRIILSGDVNKIHIRNKNADIEEAKAERLGNK